MVDPDIEEKIGFDTGGLKGMGIGWFTRVMLFCWPRHGVWLLARDLGMSNDIAEEADHFFRKIRRVDIFPSRAGSRGFQIIVDETTALYFNQDADHFVYDGWEVGKYEKGDVTIFDNVR